MIIMTFLSHETKLKVKIQKAIYWNKINLGQNLIYQFSKHQKSLSMWCKISTGKLYNIDKECFLWNINEKGFH